MLFAELDYEEHYSDLHDELLAFLRERFAQIEHGHQGDSWIWVFEGEQKVALDTFSAMKHQVKAEKQSESLAAKVIEALSIKYRIQILPEPELEPHEVE